MLPDHQRKRLRDDEDVSQGAPVGFTEHRSVSAFSGQSVALSEVEGNHSATTSWV